MAVEPASSASQHSLARRWVWRLALLFGLGLALDQAVLQLALTDGYFQGRRVAPFDPPIFSRAQERSIARTELLSNGGSFDGAEPDVEFDADLGWAPRAGWSEGFFRYDDAGARFGNTRFPAPRRAEVRRAVAIGCSFTRGDEVEVADAWPTLVDEHKGWEVANLGVGGFGLDQSLLRFRRDGLALAPDEVWITVLPAALDRLLNVYRPALRHWDGGVMFKPRFSLALDGTPTLHASPASSRSELVRLVSDQEAFLTSTLADPFVQRFPAAYAPTNSRLVHRFGAGRLALTIHEYLTRKGERLTSVRGSEIPALGQAILKQLALESAQSGALLRVFVVPCQADLRTVRAAEGERYWKGLELENNVAWWDWTTSLLELGADEDASYWMPGGHLAPKGNRLLADAILAEIE